MMDYPSYIPNILSDLSRKGIDLSEVFFEKRISSFISCEDQRIEKIDFGIDLGVGLRVIHTQKTSYAYSNDISESSLKKMAESLTCTLNIPQESICINLNKITPPRPFPVEKPFEKVSLDVKSNLVRRADHVARGLDPNLIKQVKVVYSDNIQEICLVNSEGERIEEIRPSIIFLVQVVAANGQEI
jgi:TldD protein